MIHFSDKRSKEYFLIQNPFHVAFISFAYIYFVQKLGPHLMKNREPFQLKTVMIIYNIVQIVANFSLFSLVCIPKLVLKFLLLLTFNRLTHVNKSVFFHSPNWHLIKQKGGPKSSFLRKMKVCSIKPLLFFWLRSATDTHF